MKSEFSLGCGTAPVGELAARAASLGVKALALADAGNMYGQVAFHHACRACGVRAVTGVEFREGERRRTFLARNRAGYEALCGAITARELPAWREGLEEVEPSDVVMLDDADLGVHRLLACIRRVPPVEKPESFAAAASRRRPDVEGDLDLTRASPSFPAPRLAPGDTAPAALARLCHGPLPHGDVYRRRLEEELRVIAARGLAGYLLVVSEIVDAARERGIALAGRGSAASSLVSWLLGFTQVDPIRHGLLFERFLHPARRDPPDIDLDVASDRRDELLAWCCERFGPDRIATVGSVSTLRRRSAYREGLKALGMQPRDVEEFCGRVPEEDELPAPELPLLWRRHAELLRRLVGRPHHLSVHPGGVVITDRPVSGLAPLERAAKGVLVTQHDLRAIEKLGLMKIDLRGNRALSEIREATDLAGYGSIPDDDAETWRTIGQGRTLGCFQLETPPMRAVLRRLPVRRLEDLAAALALVRPGPGTGEAKETFVRRATGEEPSPGGVLAGTHGMLLYEEDILRAVSAATGVSLAEADLFRADLVAAHDDPAGLASLRRRFHAIPAPLWDDLVRFASCSFSKAHAASYAALAWRTAWLKTRAPAAFGCAVLNHHGGLYPLRSLAAELARTGVRVLPPDVNRSAADCTLEGGAIRVGLEKLKFVTKRTKLRLVAARPIRAMSDLPDLQRRELEALVMSGACDGVGPLSAEEYPEAHLRFLHRPVPPRERGDRQRIWRALVRIQNELRFLEMHLFAHPMSILRAEADREACLTAAQAAARPGMPLRVAAVVAALRRVPTAAGPMQFVTLEDETGLLEAVMMPPVYAEFGEEMKTPGPYLVWGRMGEEVLEVAGVMAFHRRANPYADSG